MNVHFALVSAGNLAALFVIFWLLWFFNGRKRKLLENPDFHSIAPY